MLKSHSILISSTSSKIVLSIFIHVHILLTLRDVTSFACVNILTSIKSCNYGDSFSNAIIYCYFFNYQIQNVHGLKHLRYSSKHFQYCIFTYYPLLIIYTFDGLRKKVYEFSKFFFLPLTKICGVLCTEKGKPLTVRTYQYSEQKFVSGSERRKKKKC